MFEITALSVNARSQATCQRLIVPSYSTLFQAMPCVHHRRFIPVLLDRGETSLWVQRLFVLRSKIPSKLLKLAYFFCTTVSNTLSRVLDTVDRDLLC